MPAFNSSSNLQRLLDAPMRPGRLAWIGLRAERRGPIEAVDAAKVSPEDGLLGDRYGGRIGGKRQVTIIAREDLDAVATFLGRGEPSLPPDLVRRNLVTEGLNLQALKGRHLLIGHDPAMAALLEVTGECHPCSRMEEVLGTGGYNALRGRGGLTARVLRAGTIRLGDPVAGVLPDDRAAQQRSENRS
ncbi:MOSC domain-containing protein [Phenylobacterium sp.]|uniref:MOSC domain-containing protein n=1 Tax=Phenylobacterium sp. TaxID=1871053 RepID=UPI0025F8FE90|nr:MOSC domain-containing protein [Phenylobacterium sp.]